MSARRTIRVPLRVRDLRRLVVASRALVAEAGRPRLRPGPLAAAVSRVLGAAAAMAGKLRPLLDAELARRKARRP
jgi:hypothetical protein